MDRDASVGGILGEMLSLLGDSARDFALYTLVLGGLTAAGVVAGLTETTAGALEYGFTVDGSDSPASALFELLAAVASVFGTYLLLTRFLAARGRLRTGGGRFWPYVGMSILSAIGIVLGLILLIIPGVLLMVRWSAASGFLIGAGESVTGSLSGSWEATKGHGWPIFFSAIILFVGFAIVSGVVAAVLELAGGAVADVALAFVEAGASGALAAFGIAVYCRVRDDAQEIGEVFA